MGSLEPLYFEQLTADFMTWCKNKCSKQKISTMMFNPVSVGVR